MTKVFFKTTGCTANFSDTEIMKGILSKNHTVIDNEEQADVVMFNICTVKGEHPALREIRKTKEQYPDKKIVIGGCVTPSIVKPIKDLVPDASFINAHNVDQIEQAITTTVEVLTGSKAEKTTLPKVRKNSFVGIVQVATGCDSACSFCSTKLVKGHIKSYPIDTIVKEVQECVDSGCKEIWLTSTDMGCYGVDIGTDLPTLINEATKVRGPFMVRIGMGNPKHMIRFADKLIDAMKHEKVFKFLHCPNQSGNDRVLQEMKRSHTNEEYNQLITKFRTAFPELMLATDIIVGFPGETDDEFEESIASIKKTKPDAVNIARYALRQGTIAARAEHQIDGGVKKERSRALTKVFHEISIERNKTWLGWEGKIIIDERGKNDSWIGRNYAYKPVIVHGNYQLGDTINVKIEDIGLHDLRGKEI